MGTWQSAAVSFALGTVVLVAIALVAAGGFGSVGQARRLSWYYLTGGVLGAAYVTTVLVTVRSLGAGGVVAATIAGQLDQGGGHRPAGYILGVTQHPLTAVRAAGVVLLGVGTYLVVRQ